MRAPRQTQILPLAVGGVAAAALGTIPLHRLPRPLRIAYCVIPGALTAVLTHVAYGASDQPAASAAGTAPFAAEGAGEGEDAATVGETAGVRETVGVGEPAGPTRGDEDGDGEPASQSFRLVLSLGLGVLIAGASAAGIWMDHRIEDALRSRGVPAPRLLMGLGTGLITVAITASDTDETEHATHVGS
ncbi:MULTISPECIES: hypothetical protein [unclassified Brachybacterium]|uniref:hypothetical protein n=1 Tax=unclassified Brachybacterium TaxID=2623841 RepID=UPI00403427F6